MSPISLNTVHEQRIREAVKAARQGAKVCFRVNHGENRTIVWWDADKPRTQHVLTNFVGRSEPWLEAVLAEYYRQLEPQQ